MICLRDRILALIFGRVLVCFARLCTGFEDVF